MAQMVLCVLFGEQDALMTGTYSLHIEQIIHQKLAHLIQRVGLDLEDAHSPHPCVDAFVAAVSIGICLVMP